MRIYLWLPLIAALLLAVPTASAHRPDWGDANGVTEMADISTSFAYRL
jgi:hypothetical protein